LFLLAACSAAHPLGLGLALTIRSPMTLRDFDSASTLLLCTQRLFSLSYTTSTLFRRSFLCSCRRSHSPLFDSSTFVSSCCSFCRPNR
jgi:hypothetical protein